jgi:hypothetical protein
MPIYSIRKGEEREGIDEGYTYIREFYHWLRNLSPGTFGSEYTTPRFTGFLQEKRGKGVLQSLTPN